MILDSSRPAWATNKILSLGVDLRPAPGEAMHGWHAELVKNLWLGGSGPTEELLLMCQITPETAYYFFYFIYLLILCARTPTAQVVKARGQLEGADSRPCCVGPEEPAQPFLTEPSGQP